MNQFVAILSMDESLSITHCQGWEYETALSSITLTLNMMFRVFVHSDIQWLVGDYVYTDLKEMSHTLH